VSIYTKLMQARMTLQATRLNKSGLNKFAGYSYFELGDFLPAIQKIFAELNLCGVISYGKDVATLTIHDDAGASIVIESPMSSAALKGCHEVQNLGAVQTYLRRYLWVTAMEIVEHDAIDSSEGVKTPDVSAILKGIANSASTGLLTTNFNNAMQMLSEEHHAAIKNAANKRKTELKEKTNG
jgi:hypothetical protein